MNDDKPNFIISTTSFFKDGKGTIAFTIDYGKSSRPFVQYFHKIKQINLQLKSVIDALMKIPTPSKIIIRTDSDVILKKLKKESKENEEYWKLLDTLLEIHEVRFCRLSWCKKLESLSIMCKNTFKEKNPTKKKKR